MLGINNIKLQYNERLLFRGISFLINPSEKIGLVGSNGAGKSTLLKIIAGEIQADEGNISKPKEFSLGYLAQELPFNEGKTIYEEAESALSELKDLEEKIDHINHQLATRTDYESNSYLELIEDLNHCTERFSLIGGYTYHADLEKILKGLGFTNEDFTRPTSEYSGGWRMRVELAKLLIQKHDLLLLDEPTNHLDINSIIWLEEFLKDYDSSILMVSHDRAFLDGVTNRTVEVVHGKMYDYPVSYTKFVNLRAERREQQQQAQKNQEKEVKHTEQLIEKFRYKASKASFAQNLIKKLDKMDRIEIDDDDQRKMNFRFPPAPRSGKVVLKAEKLGKYYGEKKIFENVDLELERQDRLAFLGQNGQGKSTLVKIIVEKLQHEGKLEIGHNVEIGYYAQEQAKTLDGDKTLLATIEDEAPEELRKRARDLLGTFMFSGEDVDKKVKVLSGGEKGRLALCKLLLKPYNLLVMDEPTNHLDMKSKEMLKQALINYDGTLLIVSHDRHFLQGLTDKIYEFRDNKVRPFIGSIEEYLESRKLDDFRQLEQRQAQKIEKIKAEEKSSGLTYKEKKALEKDLRKAKNKIERIETGIQELEAEIEKTDAQLNDPVQFKELSAQEGFYDKYEAKKNDLALLMQDWEKAHSVLEELNQKSGS